ncbi:DoxX family protein [Photobacterium japonica]|uniref:DoxX family protein n=1 Tax=Photobacterium japonica TaxID=2910235 RepID=UPI003D0EC6FD
MKKLLALFTGPTRYPYLNDGLLLLVRLTIGSAMLYHAITKILQFSALAPSFMDPFALGSTASLVIAITIQSITGLALVLGFFTRPAALLLCGAMGFAAYTLGTQGSLLNGEPAALYSVFAFSLLIQGGGRISLEHVLVKRYKAAGAVGSSDKAKTKAKEKAATEQTASDKTATDKASADTQAHSSDEKSTTTA